MSISKEECKVISAEISAAIKPILERHGLALSKTNSTYGPLYGIKIEADKVSLGVNGVNTTSQYADAYNKLGSLYNIKPGMLGKKFVNRGREFAFAGIASSRSKYPIAALNIAEDRIYFFTADIVDKVNA